MIVNPPLNSLSIYVHGPADFALVAKLDVVKAFSRTPISSQVAANFARNAR